MIDVVASSLETGRSQSGRYGQRPGECVYNNISRRGDLFYDINNLWENNRLIPQVPLN